MPRKSAATKTPKSTKTTKSSTSKSTRASAPRKKSTKSAAKSVKKIDNATYFSTLFFIILSLTLAVIILLNLDPMMY